MADAQFSAASLPVHTPPHPMATPGYGKRTAPDQRPRTDHDFAHLPQREAAIAGYLDRLPDGADISVKTLSKHLDYGQCALRTALNRLQKEGHLRRGREQVGAESGSSHWVTRTWFTRTARDDDWWARFTRGDVPTESPPRPTRSRAHILLAALGRTIPALSLSDAECARLVPLLMPWFERGASDDVVRHALTSGLPSPVHSPVALIHSRLLSKLPAEPPAARPPRRMLECAECRVPGRPEVLPGGVCRGCRGAGRVPERPAALPPAPEIHTRAAEIRAAMAERRREGTPV